MMPSKMVFALGGCCTYILRSAKIGLRSSTGSPSLMCKCGHPGIRDAGIASISSLQVSAVGALGGNGGDAVVAAVVSEHVMSFAALWTTAASGSVAAGLLVLSCSMLWRWCFCGNTHDLKCLPVFSLGPVSYGGMLAATTESWISARFRSSACL